MVTDSVEVPDRTRLDVLYVTDLRFPGGSSASLVAEVEAATGVGYRVGALQCASTSLRADRVIHPGIEALVSEGRLDLVRPGEPVDCSLVVVKHPTVLVEPVGGRLPVKCERVVVFSGQVPVDADGTRYYTPSEVHANVVEAFGMDPVWHPVSPVVRRSLADGSVPLAGDDWVEVIDVDRWESGRTRPVGDRPVIGRHGRPTPLKWPADAESLLGAYPDSDDVLVRVLGGVDGLEAVLPRVPGNWEVLPFGSMDAAEFLAGVDFFVYYHHPDLVEAFGRTIIEALASGCVVVLPEAFRELFGEACLYAEPSEVLDLVLGLHRDSDAFRAQAEAGGLVVRQRFSHSAHVSRISALAGTPGPVGGSDGRAAPTARVPAGLRRQRPVVMVCCLGAGADSVAATIRELDRHRDHAMGFHPVLVTTAAVPEVSAALDEELRLDADQRCFVSDRTGVVVEVLPSRTEHAGDGRWEDETLSRLAGVVRRHGVTSVTVVDLSHEDAWLGLQASPRPSVP
ncbi:MAG: glycosyltransferase [Actinomycetota bacterium]|nr:glycosyltransferase [Actinomycetota bacterium]